MGRDEWYRNKGWSAATEAAFREKLSRSRSSRPQYLRIQADYITDSHPHAALALIGEYFETGDEFDVPMAFCTQARAYCCLGKIDEAIASYKRALSWEESHPGLISPARTNYPKLVAEKRLSGEYDYALDVLANRFQPLDHQFPLDRYHWNGINALIASELGHQADAREFAERALRAAAQTESPFRYHKGVGIVRNTTDEFGRRIKRLARPSLLRSLFRLISPAGS
ncbi:tetratricopeptide repeat protein [Sphingomonas jaspsi]|uniref:tetratricopeptide repeat protein n=1 Tax=Sphingomonas jaspsi TaxID=392409 RepID=UPI0012EB4621|nr:tetratricopeptide repeat protein [Sphingomonas jaspsi]